MPIFALTTASVNQSWLYPGDQITLTLSSDAQQVVFPSLDQIAGERVLYTSDAQKISIVNNQRSRLRSRSYTFKPSKSLTIPAYTFATGASTQPIKITLKTPSQGKLGDDYILQIKADKQEMFLGDEINLDVIFKAKKTVSTDNQVSISIPEIKNLLFIKNNKTLRSTDEKYNIHTLRDKLRADDFGHFSIPSIAANIGHQNSNLFSNFSAMGQIRPIKKIHSNPLTIKVNPLPDSLRIFGLFDIKSEVDKTQIKPGEATNLVLGIHGKGNFEDIEKFNLTIKDVTVYSDEPEFTHNQWQQKFALVATHDFAIPSFTLDYFDKTAQIKKRISTQPINIQVESEKTAPIAASKIAQNPTNINGNYPTNNLKYYYLLLGIVIGALIGMLVVFLKNKTTNKNKNLISQIKLARGDKALFDLLLPLNMTGLEVILQQLEANIYKNAQYKIRKKDIINVIKFERKTH